MKRALIIGISGQDGSYLTELLFDRDYEIYGIDKLSLDRHPGLNEKVSGMSVIDLNDSQLLCNIVESIMPNEIYYLAAHHFSSQDNGNYNDRVDLFLSANLLSVNAVLELIRQKNSGCKFFYAASSQIFGRLSVSPQNEETPHNPDTPYSISKSAGLYLCRFYREYYKIFTSVGILYNHESPRRQGDFITTQITRSAVLASMGLPCSLQIKNLDAVVDWGAAQDYVEAMWLTLQQDKGSEFVIASGVPHTVRDFAREAFGRLGLNWENYVLQAKNQVASNGLAYIGDSSKIRNVCGWKPKVTFEKLVRSMVDQQLLTMQSDQK